MVYITFTHVKGLPELPGAEAVQSVCFSSFLTCKVMLLLKVLRAHASQLLVLEVTATTEALWCHRGSGCAWMLLGYPNLPLVLPPGREI